MDHLAINGKQVHYRIQGKGPTIVLLHGFLESLEIWETFSKVLADDFQLLAIDLPGHGRSENHAEVHSMERMADIVQQVLSTLEIPQAVVVGHSMGGYVSLSLAARFPDIVKGIVLLHSHAAADSEEARHNRDRTITAVKADHTSFVHSFIPSLFAEVNRSRLKTEIEALSNRAAGTSKKAIIAALEGMKQRLDYCNFLAEYPLPVLFVAGKQDEKMPYEWLVTQASQAFSAEILSLENTGHMGFLECPQEILPIVSGFCHRYLV